MITHASWNKGMDGHNGRLIFLGRRVLNTYLMMFLSSHPKVLQSSLHDNLKPPEKKQKESIVFPEPEFDLASTTERLLDTYILGEYVGGPWDLQKVMRWTPALPMSAAPTLSTPAPAALRSSGLYKVRGACVEAVIGGIFHHYVSYQLIPRTELKQTTRGAQSHTEYFTHISFPT
jgi:Ribonuclease-III-like